MNMTDSAAAAARGARTEFLAFTLGNEEYGVDILKVQELRGYETCTRIAGAPDHILGVVNLRGTIVPIVDLRIRFGLGRAEYGAFTVVIMLNIGGVLLGMVVDGVSDVTALSPPQIKPMPEMDGAIEADCLIGVGTVDERMLILLDIDRLMAGAGMELADARRTRDGRDGDALPVR